MTPFLKQVADHYMALGDISRRCFIFPSRRSQVFFKKYLGEAVKASGVPIVTPKMLTINDFFYALTDSRPTDRVSLLLELHECYKEVFPQAESLDEFIFWGDVILGDFDDVDKYLASPDSLYTNIKEYKEIQDTYSYLTPSQKEAIDRFVRHFRDSGRLTVNLDTDSPDVKARFLQIWQILLPLYRNFRRSLASKGMSYEGMTYRSLAERLRREAVTDVLEKAFGDVREYVFVGLNALNECEKTLMRKMRSAGVGSFCWDYSSAMVKDPRNSASFFMSKNIEEFGQSLELDPEGLSVPEIEVISAPSAIGQVKLIPSLAQERDCAVVIPDESLLVPLLNSIPPRIKDINVTMGYPMSGSTFFDFLSLVSALQMHLRSKDGQWLFYHKQVWAIFSCGLFKKILRDDPDAREIIARVKSDAKYYIPQNELRGHPFLDLLFRPVVTAPGEASTGQIALFGKYLKDLIAAAAGRLASEGESSLELEFAARAYSAISQLEAKSLEILPLTFTRLLDQLLGSESVPFNGEPLGGLQIMGPLETRALDFEHLVILSCNEGIFPRRSVSSSFIPPELRRGFSLPTYEYQDAIWSYYFYRMIQRARTVTLVYDSRTEGLKNGEESRFIKQLEYHFNIPLKRGFVKANAMPGVPQGDIPKTEDDVEALRRSVILSASSLKNYLDCPARFYFSKIVKLKEESEVAEDLDSGMLGDIYHNTMQALYMGEGAMDPSYDVSDRTLNATFPNALREISREYAASWSRRQDAIRSRVRSLILGKLHTMEVSGRNLVLENIIVQYVLKTLRRDVELMERKGVDSFRVLGLEKEIRMEIDGLQFIGYIDRLDSFLPGELRIVDYKTGRVEDNDILINDDNAYEVALALFGEDNQKRPRIAFQLFLYDHMATSMLPEAKGRTILNSIYQPSKLFAGPVMEVPMSGRFSEEVQGRLHGLLCQMTDTSIPWKRTKDETTCSFCDFKTICGR